VLGQGDVHGVEPLGLVAGLEFLDAGLTDHERLVVGTLQL